MKLTKDQAFRASVAKWKALSKGVELYEIKFIKIDDFLLTNLSFDCGYCEYYDDDCTKCPLGNAIVDVPYCSHDKHPYRKWYLRRTKYAAKKVLDLILSTKEKHFGNDNTI